MKTLNEYVKNSDFLVCVDSDGCAMDTMDIKHFKCFGPCMITEWGLEEWEDELLDRWNEINLYSMTRGINRFLGLAMELEEINEKYTPIEGIAEFSAWTKEAPELSNKSVKAMAESTDSEIFKKALSWSLAVNEGINALPDDSKVPFEGAKEALKAAHEVADVAIVSSANPEAVEEEWGRYGLMDYVSVCTAQDVGSKPFIISKMLEIGFDKDHVLMVGDAPGDQSAAEKNGVLFYPILVRHEKESWERFKDEALPKFIDGTYKGEYEDKLKAMFLENLS